MAQAGFTPISLYYSTTSTQEPAAADLVSGELAINIADGKLFYKNSGGNVRLLSIGYGSSTVTPTNGGVQYGTGTALALTAAGSSGQILRSNGAAAPTWADLSTLGVNTISFGTTGLTPNSATAGAVTVAGTLVTANGGTGLGGATPFTANGVLYASSASALTSGSALTFDGTQLQVSGSGAYQQFLRLNDSSGANKFVDYGWDGTGAYLFTPASYYAFNVNSAEQMRLTSTGLGIGTTSPATKLHISGSTTPNLRFEQTNSSVVHQFQAASGNFYLNIDATNALGGSNFFVQQAGTSVLELNASGNLGLGVTPSAWSGFKALQISYMGIAATGAGSGDGSISWNAYNNGTNWLYGYTGGAATRYRQNESGHTWYTAPSGTAGNAISFTQAMTLDASGNLLVGGTTNTNMATVQISVGSTSTASSALQFLSTTSGSNGIYFGDGTSSTDRYRGYLEYNHASDFMVLATAATERARITSGGDLLVGGTSNTAQSEKLQVTGNIGMTNSSSPQINFYGTGSTIEFVNRDSGGAKTFSWYYAASGGGPPATLSTSGVWTNASDARGKENISEIHYGLDTVMALYPRQYDVKSDGSHAIGFVAQEVLPVVPELVHVTRRTENDEFYGLDYGSMTAVLVKAIQEQQALITSLTARVALLEGN